MTRKDKRGIVRYIVNTLNTVYLSMAAVIMAVIMIGTVVLTGYSTDSDEDDTVKTLVMLQAIQAQKESTEPGHIIKEGNLEGIVKEDGTVGIRMVDSKDTVTEVVIPSKMKGLDVTSINSNAFSSCKTLKTVTIPDTVTSIGQGAFSGCESLESITIPNGVTTIEEDTFKGCSTLTDITIPGSVTSIGRNALSGCSSLENVTIPEGVDSIKTWAFEGCQSLESVTIPSTVTAIGISAFEDCTSLKSITIPYSVTTIERKAFRNCSLKEVTLPDNATELWSFDEDVIIHRKGKTPTPGSLNTIPVM